MGGKPKLRRVESLNNLKGEGEEYGSLSGRGRSYTAIDGDTDALGLDLAAVVTHLKEVGYVHQYLHGCLRHLCGLVWTRCVLAQARGLSHGRSREDPYFVVVVYPWEGDGSPTQVRTA